jgi:glycosyltransferase involved in cell wall biosynthesis
MTTVSVIIPSYNRKPLVSRAIDSVLQQTFRDFEIIVVDDASTDGTGEDLTQNYGKEIIYRYLPQNCGVAEARNEGMKAARGTFIAFLDSDDLWYPQKLQSQMKLFDADVSLGLVYSGFFQTDILGKRISQNTPILKGMIYNDLIWGNCFATSTVIIKKTCVQNIGYFNAQYSPAEDYEYWVRICRQFKVDCVPEPLMQYCVYEDGISLNDLKMEPAERAILHDNWNECKESNPAVKNEALARIIKRWAIKYFNKNKLADFERCFFEYLNCDYTSTLGLTDPHKAEQLLTKLFEKYLKNFCRQEEIRTRKAELYVTHIKPIAYIHYENGALKDFRKTFFKIVKNDLFKNLPRNLFNYLKTFLGKKVCYSLHTQRLFFYEQLMKLLKLQ